MFNFVTIFISIVISISSGFVIDLEQHCVHKEGTTSLVCYNVNITNYVGGASDNTTIEVISNKIYNEFTVSFVDSNIPTIPRNLFKFIPNAMYLSFIGCNLQLIEKSDFLNADNLEAIYLGINQIKHLPSRVFEYAPKLDAAILDRNEIEEIDRDSFQSLPKLRVVFLNGNQIKSLPNGIFRDLNKLHHVKLEENQIETLDDNLFEDNSELATINISHNKISNVGENTFKHVQHLEMLNISYNDFTEISCNSVDILDLTSSGVKRVKINGAIQQLHGNGNSVSDVDISDMSELKAVFLDKSETIGASNFNAAANLKCLLLANTADSRLETCAKYMPE